MVGVLLRTIPTNRARTKGFLVLAYTQGQNHISAGMLQVRRMEILGFPAAARR